MWRTKPASRSDTSRVRAFWEANPMGGGIPMYYDTPPWEKPGYRLYLIEQHGELVGTFSLCPERLGNRAALYITDMALARSVRGRRLVNLACTRTLTEVLTPDIEFLTGLIATDNGDAHSTLRSRQLRVLFDTDFTVHCLPAIRAREPKYSRDFEQVCDLVNGFYADHVFFTPLAPEELESRRDFRVLVRRFRGRIVACAGLWKQQRIRRLMLAGPSAFLRAIRGASALLNRKVRTATSNGSAELVLHAITEPAFLPGREQEFRRLLDAAAWDRDAHGIQVAAHPLSPLARALRRRMGIAFGTRLYVFQVGSQNSPLGEIRGPVYHDFSLV